MKKEGIITRKHAIFDGRKRRRNQNYISRKWFHFLRYIYFRIKKQGYLSGFSPFPEKRSTPPAPERRSTGV